jgi:hypothetical protein
MRDGVIVGQDGPSIVRQAEEVAALAYAGAG